MPARQQKNEAPPAAPKDEAPAPAAPRIEIPRLPNERAERYEARAAYMLMGPERSLAAVGAKLGKSTALMERWSAADHWVDLAEQHDQTVYTLAAQAQAEAYQRDLRTFRQKYGQAGDDLYRVASTMMILFSRNMSGRVVVDKEGKQHTIPGIKFTPETLGQIRAALQTAADLEALGLRVEDLLQDRAE